MCSRSFWDAPVKEPDGPEPLRAVQGVINPSALMVVNDCELKSQVLDFLGRDVRTPDT